MGVKLMLRAMLRGAALAAVGAFLAVGPVQAQQKTIAIGTGGTGGVYYPLGGAMANVLSKYLPGVQATAEVTGIDKITDLKGKRVSTGSPGSATEVMAFRVVEAAGLDKDKDLKRERLGVSESVNAVKDRKIDAFFWVGGIPTAVVINHAATPGIKMKLIDHGDLAEKMNAKYGKLYAPSKIKAGSYPGYDKDNSITEVWNLIVTGDKMSNEDAYAIVKTLVEKKADIVAVHKEAESFSLDNQVQERSPIPFHPGALKYFKEKGIGK